MDSEIICGICKGDLENPVNFCVDKDHESYCRGCSVSYIENAITTSQMGSCPTITCPCLTHKDGKHLVISFEVWKSEVSEEISTRFVSLASSLLSFLCGGCHCLRTLDVGNDHIPGNLFLKNSLMSSDSTETAHPFWTDLSKYLIGEQVVDDFYKIIVGTHFPQLEAMPDVEAWNIFINILKIISDPERRVNLHLRYLRDRPRIHTPCCQVEHCFSCKTRKFHNGKSCLENSAGLDNTIVACPTCGISLAKGDGCDSVTCVCRSTFTWTEEMHNVTRCKEFLVAHPENTSAHCALVLCTTPHTSAEREAARLAHAWQVRNRVEVSRELLNWFRNTYSPHPSQRLASLALRTLSAGAQEAAELWRKHRKDEVAHCAAQNLIAVKSLFLTMVPVEAERPIAARALLFLRDTHRGREMDDWMRRLVVSANDWVNAYPDIYRVGLRELEDRNAEQFKLLYGTQTARFTKPPVVIPTVTISQFEVYGSSDLFEFSPERSSAVRLVDTPEVRPVAFMQLPSERCICKLVLDTTLEDVHGQFSFGVCQWGNLDSTASEGLGRSRHTWGMYDNRDGATPCTNFAEGGLLTNTSRKLVTGDQIVAKIDTAAGHVTFTVSDAAGTPVQGFTKQFTIPRGNAGDFLFALTTAVNQRVAIAADVPAEPRLAPFVIEPLLMNPSHTAMFSSGCRRHMQLILAESASEDTSCVSVSPLQSEGFMWMSICGSDYEAQNRYSDLEAAIHAVAGTPNPNARLDANNQPVPITHSASYVDLFHAASWYREHRARIRMERDVMLAETFYAIHEYNAPFVAAMNLAEYHTHRVDPQDAQESLAFMRCFEWDMQEWYDADLCSADPMIPGTARNCRCLPRHRNGACTKPIPGMPVEAPVPNVDQQQVAPHQEEENEVEEEEEEAEAEENGFEMGELEDDDEVPPLRRLSDVQVVMPTDL